MFEITVAKVKLTKAIIAQMPQAGKFEMRCGIVLGMLINCTKDSYKTMIIKYNDEYYRHSMMWKKGDLSLYRSVGKWSVNINCKSQENCNEYWDEYCKCRDIAEKMHIYI